MEYHQDASPNRIAAAIIVAGLFISASIVGAVMLFAAIDARRRESERQAYVQAFKDVLKHNEARRRELDTLTRDQEKANTPWPLTMSVLDDTALGFTDEDRARTLERFRREAEEATKPTED